MISVAFCSDRKMEGPLHAAAASLLTSLQAEEVVRFYFLLIGFDEARLAKLRRTLDATGRPYEIRFPPPPANALLRGFKPLHGSLVPYYRLLLPDLLDEDRILYLDADTLTKTNVLPLTTMDMRGKPAGFVLHGQVRTCLENKLFLSQGLDPNAPVFNSGVMLFDTREWREQRCGERCLAFCKQHPDKLVTADQTALNIVLSGQVAALPDRYNILLYPHTDVGDLEPDGIYHFAGSPKPWDIGGRFLSTSYPLWRLHGQGIAVASNPYLSWTAWNRAAHLLGPYRREIANTLRSRSSGRLG
jgi:lipopolysaccharide biosynthesis glycosyltransferase